MGVQFGNRIIASLLFAEDVVILASSSQDLQCALERFAATCEAAGIRISPSKSKVMVLDQKKVACPPWVGGDTLSQVESICRDEEGAKPKGKDLQVDLHSYPNLWSRALDNNQKGKIKGTQSTEMSFLHRLVGHTLGDRVGS